MHLSLWPYALQNAMAMHNSLPILDDGTSQLDLFSGIRVGTRMLMLHTIGCPVFALRNELASGNTLINMEHIQIRKRSEIGIKYSDRTFKSVRFLASFLATIESSSLIQ
jgi:hypothetical protein